MDPRRQLRIISWNCGGLTTQMDSIRRLLSQHSPAILLLQEARNAVGSYSALRAECGILGYSITVNADKQLVAIFRHGLCVAPMARKDDVPFRIQRLAIMVSGQRFTLRHVHGPHYKGQDRTDFVSYLAASDDGAQTIIDAGDFNHIPKACSLVDCCFPSSHTFRKNSIDNDFTSTLDGFRLSPGLVPVSSWGCLDGVPKAQHKPVMLNMNFKIDDFKTFKWNRPGFIEAAVGANWSIGMWDQFNGAVQSIKSGLDLVQSKTVQPQLVDSADRAWKLWATFCGASAPTTDIAFGNSGWCAGQDHQAICKLFKRMRRAQAIGNEHDVADAIDAISFIIEAATATRLSKWKERVQSRRGASRWLKGKLDGAPDCMPPSEEPCLPATQAETIAKELAGRWNVAMHKVSNMVGATTSCLFGDRATTRVSADPTQRQFEQANFDCFNNHTTPLQPLGEWTLEVVYDLLTGGAPGADGITSDDIYNFSEDALKALVQLLNLADRGIIPSFWCEGRVAMIPKPDAPGERRPLTIMNITYRLWARRWAQHLGAWMHTWAPKGLVGARIGEFAADTTQHVTNLINQANAGTSVDDAVCILTLDQSKYFDKMSLPMLGKLCDKVGFHQGAIFLDIYARLQRQIFVDSTPTPHVLYGPHACGIPQGCPMSCVFANFVACYWLYSCSGCDCEVIAYLDDWLVIGKTWCGVDRAFTITRRICEVVGSRINITKTKRAMAHPFGHPPPPCPSGLKRIPLVDNFKYLGIDVTTRVNACRPAAAKRISMYCKRANLIRLTHFTQRSALLADACAALWLDAGTWLTKTQVGKLVTCGAVAQFSMGHSGATMNGSRAMLHATGPGLHYTHAGAASIYSAVRQSIRMRRRAIWSHDDWARIYNTRCNAVGGIARTLHQVAKTLGADWVNHSTLRHGEHSFDFSLGSNDRGQPAISLALYNDKMHNLRVFLRRLIISNEAARLPFHYSDLSNGWCELDVVRRSTYALRFVCSGPSLLSGAVWTRWKSWKSGFDTDATCVRCMAEDESLGHRLWRCTGNLVFRNWMVSQLGIDLGDLGLPLCLSRCGLAPHNTTLSDEQIVVLQMYLIMCNNHAAQSYTNFKKGLALPTASLDLSPFESGHLRLKRLAIKPIRKSEGLLPSLPHSPADFKVDAPEVHFDGSFSPERQVDGSHSPARAGFGVVVAIPSPPLPDSDPAKQIAQPPSDALPPGITTYCGPVTTSYLSNNAAELCGGIAALQAAIALVPQGPITIGYDSEYAKQVITGGWRPKRHSRLAAFARNLLYQLSASHAIVWKHIDSHTGNYLNELADNMATLGSEGSSRPPPGDTTIFGQ